MEDFPKTSAEEAKKLLAEYREKKKIEKNESKVSSVAKPVKKISPTCSVDSETSSNNKIAVIPAELTGFKFACGFDSGADSEGISEKIANFLGDHGVFLPTRLLSVPEKLKAVDGHIVHSKGIPKYALRLRPWPDHALLGISTSKSHLTMKRMFFLVHSW